MSTDIGKILITGGAGFIGCNFIGFLRAERPDWQLVNYDALTYAGNPANLADLAGDDHYTFVHADVCDRGAVVEALRGCDAVVHLAAESHVDRSIQDCTPFISTNVGGTQTLLDACREVGDIQRIVHIGTDEVYGSLPLDKPDLSFAEDWPLQPRSPYAASKAAGDLVALAYHETYGLPITVTRCSNNFGPYQYPEKVIPSTRRRSYPCSSPTCSMARVSRFTGTGSTCVTGCTWSIIARRCWPCWNAAAPVRSITSAATTSGATWS